MVHLTRVNPFVHTATAAPPKTGAGSPNQTMSPALTDTPASSPAPSAYAPSFLDNFRSAITSAETPTATPAHAPFTVPPMPAATYTGANGAYDATAVDARTAAANVMLAAIGNNDVKRYQQGAANFLAASPAGSGLPVWASTITVDTHGNLVNTNNAGCAPDGTLVAEGGCGYVGMMNPVKGTPNIADGTANALGVVFNPRT